MTFFVTLRIEFRRVTNFNLIKTSTLASFRPSVSAFFLMVLFKVLWIQLCHTSSNSISKTYLSKIWSKISVNLGSMHNQQLTFTYSSMTNIDHFKLILRVFFFLYSQQRLQVSTHLSCRSPIRKCPLMPFII